MIEYTDPLRIKSQLEWEYHFEVSKIVAAILKCGEHIHSRLCVQKCSKAFDLAHWCTAIYTILYLISKCCYLLSVFAMKSHPLFQLSSGDLGWITVTLQVLQMHCQIVIERNISVWIEIDGMIQIPPFIFQFCPNDCSGNGACFDGMSLFLSAPVYFLNGDLVCNQIVHLFCFFWGQGRHLLLYWLYSP